MTLQAPIQVLSSSDAFDDLLCLFEGMNLRVIDRKGDPWFVAKDVCNILGLENSRKAVSSLDDDERADVTISDTSSNGVSQRRTVNIVSMSGMYNLVFKSRRAEAKSFTKWVTSDLLPSLYRRKIGKDVAIPNATAALNEAVLKAFREAAIPEQIMCLVSEVVSTKTDDFFHIVESHTQLITEALRHAANLQTDMEAGYMTVGEFYRHMGVSQEKSDSYKFSKRVDLICRSEGIKTMTELTWPPPGHVVRYPLKALVAASSWAPC